MSIGKFIFGNSLYIDETLKQADGSNGPIPDLGNGRLVPIRIDSTSGTPIVKKANIFEEWYSYDPTKREWANAVILKDGKEDNYSPGQEILASDIESYFVWIPRYSYQIFNDELYEMDTQQGEPRTQEIEIQFENKDTPIKNGSKNNEWLTHPAFTSFNSNGFWVGKFETSKNGNVDDNSISPESVQIKPNVSSWRNIKVANAFYTGYDYQRELDSHLMKNTEWGAVAYLSHSKYGHVGNINPNLNSNYLTGYEDTSNQWYTVEGQKASNIQNITGVYDMSGGAWEYVAGVMRTENKEYITGKSEANNSGFVGIYGSTIIQEQKSLTKEDGGLPWKENRYYDFYEYNMSEINFSRRILGDATGEMGPFNNHLNNWYNTHSYFIDYIRPWFIRGSSFTMHAGINYSLFDFSDAEGDANNMMSFVSFLLHKNKKSFF